jgi:hypothetical protein
MKIKLLILAFPLLCLACNSSTSDPSDPAYQMEASPLVAKQVAGVRSLTTDFNYDEPCTILGEEYIRGLFNLPETTTLAEAHEHDGCAFEWAGNKVVVSFGGSKPYASVYTAEYMFDKMYQAKPEVAVSEPVEETDEAAQSGPESEGTVSEGSAADSTHQNTDDKHPNHSGVTAATPPLTEHAVSTGNFEAVSGVGDKAVWDATTGAMHVLYNNHIINVTVGTKDKAEARKEHAQNLAEVLIEKIAENEYVKRL